MFRTAYQGVNAHYSYSEGIRVRSMAAEAPLK